ncbi:hypothetical protein NQ166_14000 [Microbacterium sp. zg.Y1090]|uniref:hypothetical protein n=1 Tax=Microbacterium wangruii TaxID=3049073 RepID=UPI00214D8BEC|nr:MULTISPECIES: hypothetical protein [unclassified Microbacterium]MCR2819943.1 hypothetical protein [Microbacterium sp. zg.Y1090]MDL5488175.1 hypothetical protein [Microbacterium sp. zg-Y1211]WIM29325.1 hypothetical protein QNO26_05370 [Microbacterium sp. zg-Y1090]
MPDLGRFLPLSNRPHGDESAVTADRRAQLADLIAADAGVLAALPAPRAAALAGEYLTTARIDPPPADDVIGGPAHSAALLERAAATVRAGRRRGIRALAHGVRAHLRLAAAIGSPPRLPPTVTGAVALYAATSAPFDRRAVVAGHTVRADDDGWEFGRGPVLAGNGADIAAFLLGVSDRPPQPPARRPATGTLEG